MIDVEKVIKIHKILINIFGGSEGLRDINLLNSALNRPFHTFDSKELYPSTVEKAAALIESIIKNHPFVDGNKRVGYVLMRLVLIENKMDLFADMKEKYDFVIKIASGKLSYDGILKWIKQKIKKKIAF